jgi:hypothetical protein
MVSKGQFSEWHCTTPYAIAPQVTLPGAYEGDKLDGVYTDALFSYRLVSAYSALPA